MNFSKKALVRDIAIVGSIVFGVHTAVAQPFHAVTESMMPTIEVGDYMLASKFAYGYSRHSLPLAPDMFSGRVLAEAPKRGDIVVFKLPRDTSQSYVKRLIGLPGDRLRIENGVLVINDVPATLQPAENHQGTGEQAEFIETLPGGSSHHILVSSSPGGLDNMPEVVVPPGHYFMMGDNRSASLDSRIKEDVGGVGFVPEENLLGRVDLRFFSATTSQPSDDTAGWLHKLGLDRIGSIS